MLTLHGNQFTTKIVWPYDYYEVTDIIVLYIIFLHTHMTMNSVKSYFSLIASDIFPPRELDHSKSQNESSYTLSTFSKRVCMYILFLILPVYFVTAHHSLPLQDSEFQYSYLFKSLFNFTRRSSLILLIYWWPPLHMPITVADVLLTFLKVFCQFYGKLNS